MSQLVFDNKNVTDPADLSKIVRIRLDVLEVLHDPANIKAVADLKSQKASAPDLYDALKAVVSNPKIEGVDPVAYRAARDLLGKIENDRASSDTRAK
jgi:hypothetical protein